MLQRTLGGGIDPTKFWMEILSFFNFAEMENQVKEEVNSLPHPSKMSTFYLARVPYVLGAYQNRYYKKKSKSPVLEHWKNIREDWQNAANDKLPDFGLKDVAETLIGFVNLGEKPQKDFLDGLYDIILNELVDDSPRPKDVVRLYSAFSELGLKNPPEEVKASLMDALIEKLPTFDAKQTPEIIRSLSNLEVDPPKEFWAAYYPRAVENFGGMEDWELSGLLKPFAKLGVEPSDKAPHKFLSGYVSALEGRLEGFKPASLVATMEAFASLNLVPPESFRKAMFSVSGDKLGAFDDGEMSRLVRAFAKLNMVPPETFLKQLADAGNFGHKKLNPESSANILWSFAAFSVSTPLPKETMEYAKWLLKKAKTEKANGELDDVGHTLCHLSCRRLFPEEKDSFDLDALRKNESPVKQKFLKQLAAAGFENDKKLGLVPGLKVRTDFSFLMQSKNGKKVTVLVDIEPAAEEKPVSFYDTSPILMTSFIVEGYQERMKRDKSHTSLVYIRIPERVATQLKGPTKLPLFHKMKEIFPNLPAGIAFRLKFDNDAMCYEPILYVEPPKTAARPEPKAAATGRHLAHH